MDTQLRPNIRSSTTTQHIDGISQVLVLHDIMNNSMVLEGATVTTIQVKAIDMKGKGVPDMTTVNLLYGRRIGEVLATFEKPLPQVRELIQCMYKNLVYDPSAQGWLSSGRTVYRMATITCQTTIQGLGGQELTAIEAMREPQLVRQWESPTMQVPLGVSLTINVRYSGEARRVPDEEYQEEVMGWLVGSEKRLLRASI